MQAREFRAILLGVNRSRAGAVLLALAAACGDRRAAPPPPPASFDVRTAPVARGPVPRTLVAIGTLFGDEEATVAAKVAGRIAAVRADLGDVLPVGAPLAQVDPTDYLLARAERQKALLESLARLGLDAVPEGAFDVAQFPFVERARLQAQLARSRYERAKALHDENVLAEEELEQLKSAWDVAENDHRVAALDARARLAQSRTLQAELATAEQRLADTTHVVPGGRRPDGAESPAPHEYAVAERRVSVGDFVQPGDPLFRIVDPDPLRLRVGVPERRAGSVRVGAAAEVRVDGAPDPIGGRVARIAPAADPRTRTIQVEIAVPNPGGKLRPGGFARATIDVGSDPGVMLVPADAIASFAGVHRVFVAADGRAAERRVTPGQRVGDNVEIVDGLTGAERVIVAPPANLTAGAVVRDSGGAAGD